jgi:DNA-binding CsgD family transcriptional regulator
VPARGQSSLTLRQRVSSRISEITSFLAVGVSTLSVAEDTDRARLGTHDEPMDIRSIDGSRRRVSLGTGPALEAVLTPGELRVALLVAEGATNNEAAASLVLSRRTVESHLLCVYRKLGLRSRSQLARLVAIGERDPSETRAVG